LRKWFRSLALVESDAYLYILAGNLNNKYIYASTGADPGISGGGDDMDEE
jgi:hypothetical protein